MHDVANIEAEDPVIWVEILYSKSASRSYLKLLLVLQFVHLFNGLEGDLESLLLCHSILEVLSSLVEWHLWNVQELLLEAYQLFHCLMSLLHLFVENLNFLGDIVRATPIACHWGIPTSFWDTSYSISTKCISLLHAFIYFTMLVRSLLFFVIHSFSVELVVKKRI